MSALWKLKTRLDIHNDEQDALLGLLLAEARSYILAYTRRSAAQWLDIFEPVAAHIAAVNYRRLGDEGVKSAKEGELLVEYEGYPPAIHKALDGYRLVKGL